MFYGVSGCVRLCGGGVAQQPHSPSQLRLGWVWVGDVVAGVSMRRDIKVCGQRSWNLAYPQPGTGLNSPDVEAALDLVVENQLRLIIGTARFGFEVGVEVGVSCAWVRFVLSSWWVAVGP